MTRRSSPRIRSLPARRFTAQRKALLASTALGAALLIWQAPAYAGPEGGNVVAGQAVIARPDTSTTLITQSTKSVIIDWRSFNIGSNETVKFSQPSTDALAVNRVTDSQVTNIFGKLLSNGNVAIINPAGIIVHNGAQIDVGGLIASGHRLSDADALTAFNTGKFNLTPGEGGAGSVINNGSVTVREAGLSTLTGGRVSNNGTIIANVGKVSLAAGEVVTVDLAGDGLVSFAATQPKGQGAKIDNAGTIQAARVELSVAQAAAVVDQSINMSGIIRASSVKAGRDGTIILDGGDGAVSVTGTLDASSKTAKGGKIQVTGRNVALKGATLDASGATGGGSVRVGGGYQGGEQIARATTTAVDSKTKIDVSATQKGDGGSAVVWSDQRTDFAGSIFAKGAIEGGNGGTVEVSGKVALAFNGAVDSSAANGKFGSLLLDPYNLTVVAGSGGAQTASANDSTIGADTIANLLKTSDVTLSTGTGGSQAGDITVNSAISWTGATSLTLTAAGKIAVNAAITNTSGGLVLQANGGGITIAGEISTNTLAINSADTLSIRKTVTVGGAGDNALSINYATYSLSNAANSTYDSTLKGTFDLAQGAKINVTNAGKISLKGETYTVIRDKSALSNIRNGLSGLYVLGSDIDGSGSDFSTIGNATTYFTGKFDGLGHNINKLSITSSGSVDGGSGLFGALQWATVSHLSLVDMSMTTSDRYTGALVGTAGASAIFQTSASGFVSGGGYTGGLVGSMGASTLIQASASVTVKGGDYTGGLVGYSKQSYISQSFAQGDVFGSQHVGGLIGRLYQGNTVEDSFAWGDVTGSSGWIGGFVGSAAGVAAGNVTIRRSYSTGAVTVTSTTTYNGAFVGTFSSAVLESNFTTGTINGKSLVAGVTTNNPNGVATGVSAYSFADLSKKGLTDLGLDKSGAWTIRDGQSFPTLSWKAPTVFILSGVTDQTSGTVNVMIDGRLLGVASINSDNSFTFSGNAGKFTRGRSLLVTVTDVPNVSENWAMTMPGGTSYSDVTLKSGVLTLSTNSASDGWTAFSTAKGSITGNGIMGLTGDSTSMSLASGLLNIVSTGDLAIDRAITADQLSLKAAGRLTVAAKVTVENSADNALIIDYGTYTMSDGGERGTFDITTAGMITITKAKNISLKGETYSVLQSVDDVTGSAMDMGGRYVLARDYDFSARTKAFTSIGTGLRAFKGKFDGFGHTISNFTYTTNADLAGFFGDIDGATISHIQLLNASVTSTYLGGGTSGTGTGILVGGANGGAIFEASVSGSVRGNSYTGGLVGTTSGTTIIRGSADVDLVSDTKSVGFGGLVGLASSSKIRESFSQGTVFVKGSRVGGLVGDSRATTISDSFSTSEVIGEGGQAGGLIGYQIQSTISQSFATGNVDGSTEVGAFVGSGSTSGLISFSYSTGRANGVTNQSAGSGPGSSWMSLASFKSMALTALGSSSVWSKASGAVPQLIWRAPSASFTISGASDDRTSGKFNVIVNGKYLGSAYVEDDKSFSFSARSSKFLGGSLLLSYQDTDSTQANYVTSLKNYTDPSLTGIKTVSGALLLNASSVSSGWQTFNEALGSLNSSTYRVMGLTNTNNVVDLSSGRLVVKSDGDLTVDLAITADRLTLQSGGKLTVGKSVTVGGSVADALIIDYKTYSLSNADNAANDAALKGTFDMTDGVRINVTNAPSVTIKGDSYKVVRSKSDLASIKSDLSANYVLGADIDASGGAMTTIGDLTNQFVGNFDGLGHSISKLTISQAVNYGGLFGYAKNSTISHIDMVDASVSGVNYTGPLVGYADTVAVFEASASGRVQGGESLGGLVGIAKKSTFVQTSAYVDISGSSVYVGGLIGTIDYSLVDRSFAQGNISVDHMAGGLIGQANNSTIKNSFSLGDVTATLAKLGGAGGLVALVNNSKIEKSYATGDVTGGTSRTGALAGLQLGTNSYTGSFATGLANGATNVAVGDGTPTGTSWMSPADLAGKSLKDLAFDETMWTIRAGQGVPSLLWRGPATFTISGTSDQASGTVNVIVNGVVIGTAAVNSDKSFSFSSLVKRFTAGKSLLVTLTDVANVSENWATTLVGGKSLSGVDLKSNILTLNANKVSDAWTLFSTAKGNLTGNGIMGLTGDSNSMSLTSGRLNLISSGDMVIDRAITADMLSLTSGGKLSIGKDIVVGNAADNALIIDYKSFSLTDGGSKGTFDLTNGASITISKAKNISIKGETYGVLQSIDDLNGIGADLTGKFVLARDFDFSTRDSSKAFTPFGSSTTSPFKGKFEGLGHSLSNFAYTGSADYAGLFGATSGATISHFNMVDAKVNSSTAGSNGASGMLVGRADTSAFFSVSVSGDLQGGPTSGGVVGMLMNSTIIRSAADVDVSGGSNSGFGGLVGYASDSKIQESFSQGTVFTSGSRIGGLVGSAVSTSISDSFSTSQLKSTGTYIGGLVGFTSFSTISNSFATGNSIGSGDTGALVGRLGTGSSVSNSFGTGKVNGATNVAVGTRDTGATGGTWMSPADLNSATLAADSLNLSTSLWSKASGAAPQLIWRGLNIGFVISGLTDQASGRINILANGKFLGFADLDGTKAFTFSTRAANVLGGSLLLTLSGAGTTQSNFATSLKNYTGSSLTDLMLTSDMMQLNGPTASFAWTTFKDALGSLSRSTYNVMGLTNTANVLDLSAGRLLLKNQSDLTIDLGITTNELSLISSGKLSVQNDITVKGAGTSSLAALVLNYAAYSLSNNDNSANDVVLKGTFDLANGSKINLTKANSVTIKSQSYQVIRDKTGLANIQNSLSSNYVLGDDIDLSGSTFESLGRGAYFNGKLDGFGHVVSNLSISRPYSNSNTAQDNNTGLFSYLYMSTVSHLNLSDVYVSSGYSLAGALAGDVGRSGIFQVTASGRVIGSNNFTGGLIGRLTESSLVQAYASVDVNATSDNAGGLVGYSILSLIAQSFAQGDVTSTGNDVGGLVGLMQGGSIANSFATGDVKGNLLVGGLVGEARGYQKSGGMGGNVTIGGSITSSYASGNVTGAGQADSFAGFADATYARLTSTFATGLTNGKSNIAARATWFSPEIFAKKSLSDLGFDNTIWTIRSGDTAPSLIWRAPTDYFKISGTVGETTGSVNVIVNGALIGKAFVQSDKSFQVRLASKSVASDGSLLLTYSGTSTALENWATKLTGGKSLSGVQMQANVLTLNASSASDAWSLFSTAKGSLTGNGLMALTGDSTSLTLTSGRLALVSASNLLIDRAITAPNLSLTSQGTLSVTNSLTVSGSETNALSISYKTYSLSNAIDGAYDSTLRGTFNLATDAKINVANAPSITINNDSYIVIKTQADLDAVRKSFSSNYVLGTDIAMTFDPGKSFASLRDPTYSFSGKFDGFGHAISNLKIASTVSNTGLFGFMKNATISHLSLLDADVTNTQTSAGVLGGYADTSAFFQIWATGRVKGTSQIGGLVGISNTSTFVQTAADVDVTGSESWAGGLIGASINSAVTQSFAQGDVRGSSLVGGLIGEATYGNISDSFATGAVTATSSDTNASAGGLIGNVGKQLMIVRSYASGDVTGSKAGALVGVLAAGSGSDIGSSVATGLVNGATGKALGSGTASDATWMSAADLADKSLGDLNFSSSTWTIRSGDGQPTLIWRELNAGFIISGTSDQTSGQVHVIVGGKDLGAVDIASGGSFSFRGRRADFGAGTDVLLTYVGSQTPTILENYLTHLAQATSRINNVSLTKGRLSAVGDWSTLTSLNTSLSTARGSLTGLGIIPTPSDLFISTSSAFEVDKALSAAKLRIESAGDLTISAALSSTATSTKDALVLVAGVDKDAGTKTGGDIILAKAGSISVDATSSASLYTGSVSGSSVVASKIDAANYRYDSDETKANYSKALAGTGLSLIYRETVSLDLAGHSVYDGTSGRSASVNGGSYAMSAKEGTIKNAGDYTVSSSEAESVGLTVKGGTYTIDQREVTVSNITAKDRQYDGTKTAELNSSASFSDLIKGDDLTIKGAGTFASKDASTASQTVTITQLALDGASAGNYKLASTGQPKEATGTISKREVSVDQIAGVDKVYDGKTDAVLDFTKSYSWRVDKDDVSLTATGNFDSKNVGTGMTVTITDLALKGTAASNYTIKSAQKTTTASITQREVVVSGITVADREYDGTDVAALVTKDAAFGNIVTGESLTVSGKGVFDSTNAKSSAQNVTISGLTLGGSASGNYKLKSTGQQDKASATITQRTLTITGYTGVDKTYDGGLSASLSGTPKISNLVQNESVSVTASGKYRDKNVDTGKTIDITLSLGSGDSNYRIGTDSQKTTTASISQREITVSNIKISDKVYDGTTDAVFDYNSASMAGLIKGDLLSVTAAGAFSSKDVGTRTVSFTKLALTGDDAKNYKLASSSQQGSATAQITQREVTVSGITVADREYDGTDVAALVTKDAAFGNIVTGESLTVSGKGVFASKNANSSAQNVTISGLTLGGTGAGNYKLKSTGQQDKTSATITQRTLTITGYTGVDKTYDGGLSASLSGTPKISNLVQNESVSVTASGKYRDKNVDTGKTIDITLSLGSGDSNYRIGTDSQKTTTASISQREVAVSGITASNKTYDGAKSATLNFGNAYGWKLTGDDVSVGGMGTFDTKDAGSGKTVTITDLGLTGTDAKNYKLASTGQQGSTKAAITQLDVTVSGLTADDKIYDGSRTASMITKNAAFSSKISGDDLGVDANGTFETKDVGKQNVTISGLKLTGKDAANYNIISGSQTTTSATITQRELTISDIKVNDKVYDGKTAATFDYSGVTYTGYVAKDVLGVTTTGDFASKDVGTRRVTFGDLTLTGADAKNYKLATKGQQTYADAQITQREVTVLGLTVADRDYDGTDVASVITNGAKFNNIVDGDSLSVTAKGNFASPNASSKAQNVAISNLTLGGKDVSNYKLASNGQQTSTQAFINRKLLTVTVDDKEMDYNGRAYDGAWTVSYSGFVTGESKSDLKGTLSFSGPGTTERNVGNYRVSADGNTSENYKILYVDGTLRIVYNVTVKQFEAQISKLPNEMPVYKNPLDAPPLYSIIQKGMKISQLYALPDSRL